MQGEVNLLPALLGQMDFIDLILIQGWGSVSMVGNENAKNDVFRTVAENVIFFVKTFVSIRVGVNGSLPYQPTPANHEFSGYGRS